MSFATRPRVKLGRPSLHEQTGSLPVPRMDTVPQSLEVNDRASSIILPCYHEPSSYLIALDARTGATRRKVDRGSKVLS
jgi:hypothetical protein